jgi:cytochrome c
MGKRATLPCVGAAVVFVALPYASAAKAADDAAKSAVDLTAAQQQFLTSCGVCHTAVEGEAPRQGPNLHTVYGRKAGTQPDFKYSDALKNGNWVWNETTLDSWIEDPQAAHPGTFMNYRQANPQKRKLVIDYLKSLAKAQ